MIQSASEFVRLRTSKVLEEYQRAAMDEATIEVWMDVVARHPRMRSWVAHNKTVPIEVLAVLAADPDPYVRCAVADKRKLTPDLFQQLAHDPDDGVRARIACNRKAPSDLLDTLAGDSAPLVREAACTALARRESDRP